MRYTTDFVSLHNTRFMHLELDIIPKEIYLADLHKVQGSVSCFGVTGAVKSMIGTRPDLSFAVATLAKFSSAPTAAHLAACKRVMRYLRGTSSYGIKYGGNASFCIGVTDSDYAGDRNNRRSTSGYVFMLCGGAISWKARQQTSVALSSTEAEYVAATEACKEMIWLNQIMKDLSIPAILGLLDGLLPPVLYIDNQAALSLARNPSFHSRTKHIDVRYHLIRTEVAAKTINLQQIGTKENTADICTKALPKPTFEQHTSFH